MQYERCQVPSCPLTGGWENINHAVKPGCIQYNQTMVYDDDISDLISVKEKHLIHAMQI